MAKVVTDENKIKEFLDSRYIEMVFPSKEKVVEIMAGGKRLVFYLGIDPTGPSIHLGHTIPLLLLKKIGELGHNIILLIGDFTARIGDPKDKEAVRTALTKKEVEQNMKTYVGQAKKIIGEVDFEVKYNSKWLDKMSFAEVIKLTSHITVQQMMDRDLFMKRLRWDVKCENCGKASRSPIHFGSQEIFKTTTLINNKFLCPYCQKMSPLDREHIFPSPESAPVYLNEFLYPLMQGYDSVAMRVDGEVGGNDQTFNMLVGRDLVKEYLGKEKLVFTTKLLVDTATGKKTSKTDGGFIAVNDSPEDVFGKTMKSIPDKMIKTVFELCTEKPQDWIDDWQKRVDIGENPKNFKEELAFELVRMYHGEKAAERAKENFEKVFSQGQLPEEMDEFKISGRMNIADLIKESGLANSMSEAKRLIDQRAVSINDHIVTDWEHDVKSGDVVKVGPRRFLKIK